MTRTKIQQVEFEEKIKPFYNSKNGQHFCKKCNLQIKSKLELHYQRCNGAGTVRNNSQAGSNHIYSHTCDMGCGNISQFFHKNGKAYCSKLGSNCPIKIEKDRAKKTGVNPFEGIEHHRCLKGVKPWNAGLTKENSTIIANSAEKLKSTIKKQGHYWQGKFHSMSVKAKISNVAKKRKLGGYVKGSGRGKKGWYKGFFCDSSWELAYVIYCLEHSIAIQRSNQRRNYSWKNKNRIYIPDFVVGSKTVEIKGYKTPQWLAKLNANKDIEVLYKEEMKPILEYVINKYGKSFISLYENRLLTNNMEKFNYVGFKLALYLGADSNIDAQIKKGYHLVTRCEGLFLETLLKFGGNVHANLPKGGYFPIHMSATKGHAISIELLVKYGADIHAVYELPEISKVSNYPLGWTALICSCIHNKAEAGKKLLDLGANPLDANEKGVSSIDICFKNKNEELANYIKLKS